jgi:flagellar basal-body rod protein FlgC
MDYGKAFAISAAGMSVERTRVEVASANLANANVALGADGQGFQPMRVVVRSGSTPGAFSRQVEGALAAPLATVVQAGGSTRTAYEPGHPLADARGFVAYPAVDPATEMVTLMGAMRSYEANVAAMNVTRALSQKTLEIGGKS